MSLVTSQAWLLGGLSNDITTLLSGAVVRLFQNNHVPDVLDLIGAYTQCNFAGYGQQSITLSGSPVWNPVLSAYVQSFNPCTFNASGAALAQTIYGIYVVSSIGVLLWAERDPAAPFTILANGSYTYVPSFSRKNQ